MRGQKSKVATKKSAKKKAARPEAARKRVVVTRATGTKTRKIDTSILIKRVYDPPGADDGLRILIDRLWPRGVSKSKLKLDAWPKHLSPSNALRKWYRHDPGKFGEFRKRYLAELKAQGEGLSELRA